MLGCSFLFESPKNFDCIEEPDVPGVLLPEKMSPIPSSIPIQSSLLASNDQVENDILSSIFGNPNEIHSPMFEQFPVEESNQSTQVNARRRSTRSRKRPRLCHFLLELLADPEQYSSIVEWVDRENGVFKFLNSSAVASQWGKRRDKPNMKYENFARSLRTYIAKGIMTKPRSRLVYRFVNKHFE